MKIFDWDKAATMILESSPSEVFAGFYENWRVSRRIIYEDSVFICRDSVSTPRTPYLFSDRNTPSIWFVGDMDPIPAPCWILQKDRPEWNGNVYWPESARKILKG